MDMHKAGPAPVDFEGSSMYSSTTPAWRSMIVPLVLVLCVCVGCGDAQVPANRGFRRAALSEAWDGRERGDTCKSNEQRVLYYIVANRN